VKLLIWGGTKINPDFKFSNQDLPSVKEFGEKKDFPRKPYLSEELQGLDPELFIFFTSISNHPTRLELVTCKRFTYIADALNPTE
jgi:hypothetical protein